MTIFLVVVGCLILAFLLVLYAILTGWSNHG